MTGQYPIEADLVCPGGYNLRRMPLDGRCPECGSPVIEAVRAPHEMARLRPCLKSKYSLKSKYNSRIAFLIVVKEPATRV